RGLRKEIGHADAGVHVRPHSAERERQLRTDARNEDVVGGFLAHDDPAYAGAERHVVRVVAVVDETGIDTNPDDRLRVESEDEMSCASESLAHILAKITDGLRVLERSPCFHARRFPQTHLRTRDGRKQGLRSRTQAPRTRRRAGASTGATIGASTGASNRNSRFLPPPSINVWSRPKVPRDRKC